jgi:hypothetical protein
MSEFSVGKALLHVVFAVALFIAVGVAFAVVTQATDARALGEAAGKTLLWVVLAAFAASWAFQTDKGLVGILLTGVLLLIFCFQLADFMKINKAKGTGAGTEATATEEEELPFQELNAAERRRPETIIANDRARLCQPALEFSLPQPTGFVPSPELESQLASGLKQYKDINLGQWAFENGDTGQRLIIQAAKGIGKTESNFRAFTKGLRKGVEKTKGVHVESENVDWTGGRGEYEMSAQVNGNGITLHCVSRGGGGGGALTVCVTTPTAGGDPLQSQRNGIRLTPCSA